MILADTVGDSSSGKSVIYYNQCKCSVSIENWMNCQLDQTLFPDQNMDSISNNLEALVVEFFSKNGDVKNISKTNQILTEAQSSKEAWYFVWQFLKLEKPLDVQYFGANTLFNKLTKQYHEVVKECQEEQIRQQIFETLLQYLNCANYMECNFILSKLISCLSVYVIQTIGTTWPTAIQDTVNVIQPEKFAQLPPTRVIFVLLQILNSVPEEWNVIYVDKNKRSQVRLELEKQAEFVLHIVYKVLSEENISDNITKICLKCLSNWSVNIGAIVLPENHSNSIILALNAMCNENTCHEAVEAITDIYTSPFMEKHPKLVLELIEKLPALEPIILKAIHESKLDLLKDLYLLFISIGESHSRLLLDTLIEQPKYSNAILKLLQIILKCSATPTYYGYDETISNLPFNFWITLLDDIMGSDESKLQTYLTMFGEILHSLIDIFITKLQYPSDEIHEHEWDSDDREKFRIYRQDIGDAFTFCYNILRSSMLKSLMEHFNKAVNQIMISATQNEILSSTRYYEAVLFAFSSIAESIAANESVCVPHIFRSFQELPLERINHPYLLVTIMNFMSACTEWLYYNIDYIAYTISVIELALKSKSRLVIVSATMALKIITPECQVHLHKYAPMIIVLCQEHLNDPSILYKEKARLMYTLGTILSIMPLEVIMQTVDRIVIPIIAQLQSILYTEPSNKTPEVQLHVNGLLQILTNLFGNLDVNLKGTQLEEGDELISKSVAQKSAKNSIKPQPLYLIFEKVNTNSHTHRSINPMIDFILVDLAIARFNRDKLCIRRGDCRQHMWLHQEDHDNIAGGHQTIRGKHPANIATFVSSFEANVCATNFPPIV